MNDLKLPIIKKVISKSRILSMNDYFKFVQFNLKQAFDKKAYLKWKKMMVVNAPFFIK